MKTPDYKQGDIVKFIWGDERKTGSVAIVDANGTFEQCEEPSYDIRVDGEGLYKHVRESEITGLGD